MKLVDVILADLIRRGRVTVDIPGLDMEALEKTVHDGARQKLLRVAAVVYDEDITDREKIAVLRELLDE